MNPLPQAVPSVPADRQHASRSARWTAAFVVAVGFGFMASALIDASVPTGGAVVAGPPMASPPAIEILAPSAGEAENFEVNQAVRNWAWETPSADSKPASRQDLQELWLAH